MSTNSPQHSHASSHSHTHGPSHSQPLRAPFLPKPRRSVLAWPAWLRALAVLPMVLLLWLAVLWANEGAALW
ncbi:MAG: hypothetical protein PHQ58_16655 [Rhodoferax sp.]|uniref:hypothetical protein n=1 Tax=Rhodoferax sp. TaxID=50421 RepID=UPI00261C685C|nr:hypothetical protein [Rhodoferax sp.]MDD2882059.1 hypothetical protein [Rhodoferax sp.]